MYEPRFIHQGYAMKTEPARQRMTEVIRRKHLARNTEQSYCAWLKRYCHYLVKLTTDLPSEQIKLERFFTALAQDGVVASTQNQALKAIIFFYQAALGWSCKTSKRCRLGGRVNCGPCRPARKRCVCSGRCRRRRVLPPAWWCGCWMAAACGWFWKRVSQVPLALPQHQAVQYSQAWFD